MTDGTPGVLESLVWISASVAIAPLVVGLVRRPRVPEVVLLLALGIAIGPYGLDLAAEGDPIHLVAELGLGFLFLMAGLEIDPRSLAHAEGTRAAWAWLASMAAAFCLMWVVSRQVEMEAWTAVAIALTSTALGTLIPILRDSGLREGAVGRLTLINGAMGELGPIVAMSVLLTADSAFAGLLSLALFGGVAFVVSVTVVRHGRRARRLRKMVAAGADTTAQAPIRLVVLLLVSMLALSTVFGLDIILGAFVAGATVRLLLPPEHAPFMARLDGIAFGFFVPVFFVTSGMGIDIAVVLDRWATVLLLFVLIVGVRGLPVLVACRKLPSPQGAQVALLSATGLPIIVAVTAVTVEAGSMSTEEQSLIVGAGMLTVLALPILAVSLSRRSSDVG